MRLGLLAATVWLTYVAAGEADCHTDGFGLRGRNFTLNCSAGYDILYAAFSQDGAAPSNGAYFFARG